MPLAIDLFCGLGGWASGLLAEGWDVVGFDIERHQYAVPVGGTGEYPRCRLMKYPAQLVLQNVLTIHGSQFRNADLIVASPPCTEYSYMAMPWSRAKQIAGALREEVPFPEDYRGSRTLAHLNALFNACFRIQREASEAAGRYIPMVVENVKGAQPWVGKAQAHYGSFYLWGDVAMVGNRIVNPMHLERGFLRAPRRSAEKVPGFNFHQFEKTGKPGGSFQTAATKVPGLENGKFPPGGLAQGYIEGQKVTGQNPDGRKLPSGHDTFAKTGKPCNKLTDPRYGSDGIKQGGEWWHDPESITRRTSSKSPARKAASAMIAKIPEPLARWVGENYRP